MPKFEQLLQQNRHWSAEKKKQNPGFFTETSATQHPEFLWIGCSDSRVPAEIIVDANPGEIFIHRNFANLVIHTDFNCLSVIQYAVNVLKVSHIIVCGHYDCGGVQAVFNKQGSDIALTNKWLLHLKDIYRLYHSEVDAMSGERNKINKLVELNVVEQVHALAHTSIVQKAWSDGHHPMLHGWVYNSGDGLIKSLITLQADKSYLHPIFQYADDGKASHGRVSPFRQANR